MHEREGRRVFNPAYGFILESGSRDAWQKPRQVMDALSIDSGTRVADIGAGTGYFTSHFAARVGSEGRVFATDPQEEMQRELRARARREGWRNVEVRAATFDAPSLPANCCDIVFFSSVYKEIRDRESYMRAVTKSLREGGRVAILEYRPDVEGPGPPTDMRMNVAQIDSELSRAGYARVEQHAFIERQYFLVYEPLR